VTISVSDKGAGKPGSNTILLKKATTDLWITISAPDVADGQYFGQITLNPQKSGANNVVIPVAFNKKQGLVTLTHDCSPTTIPKRTGLAHCVASVANFSQSPAHVSLTVTNLDKGKLNFSNVSAPASAIKNGDGVQWNGTLTPSIPPQISSVSPANPNDTPNGGYLPLTLFGGSLVVPGGDDAITNFNVPTFYFGGEPYSQIGVVTDGYVVIGGGTAADVNFAPQTFPNPARPNNVVAPFWNDLITANSGTSNTIRVNVLAASDGEEWIVVDFEAVKNFSNANTHTGEVWLKVSAGPVTGPASEQTTISYANANSANGDPGSGINWGAENRDGTSGKNIPAPGPADNTEYFVVTSPPQAGGTATITYDASSTYAGTYKSVASMTSDVTPGTTQVVQTITVTG
jgi:hypothetical protein